jgi:hypothetical protein
MREPRNRVVQLMRFGDPDGIEVVDAPLPTADRGEVRVRVLASSPACAWFELVPYPPRKIRRTSGLLIRVGASPSIARRPLSRT